MNLHHVSMNTYQAYIAAYLSSVGHALVKVVIFALVKMTFALVKMTFALISNVQGRTVAFIPLGLGITIIIMVALLVLVSMVIGFTPVGPRAQSMAATWQGGIGLVRKGSAFAICQSMSMSRGVIQRPVVLGLALAGIGTGLWALNG